MEDNLTLYAACVFMVVQMLQIIHMERKLKQKHHIIEEQASLLRLYATAMDSTGHSRVVSTPKAAPKRTKLFDTRSRQATSRHLERQR